MTDQHLPLVFIHGYPLDASMWEEQLAHFADRPAIAPSLPGFGGTPAGSHTMEGFAASVIENMDAAGIDRAVIVGLSMGGYVAFRLWEGWPDRAAALVLVDTRATPDNEEGAAKRTAQAERVRKEGVGWLPEAQIPAVLGETTRSSRPNVVEAVRRMIAGGDREGVARAAEAMRDRPDSTPLLESISVPCLVVVGAEDTLTPLADAKQMVKAVPGAELAVIPGAGHLSSLENPEEFNRVLSDFLEGASL